MYLTNNNIDYYEIEYVIFFRVFEFFYNNILLDLRIFKAEHSVSIHTLETRLYYDTFRCREIRKSWRTCKVHFN